mgnify:CR=1 FL=1
MSREGQKHLLDARERERGEAEAAVVRGEAGARRRRVDAVRAAAVDLRSDNSVSNAARETRVWWRLQGRS